jgi:uncharacterized repeat protein (TIGR01451 family)
VVRVFRAPLLLAVVGIAGLVVALAATAAPLKKPPPPTTTTALPPPTTTTIVTTTTVIQTVPAPPPPPPPPAPPSADISVATLGAASSLFAGDSVTYTTIVTNHGPDAATGVVLVDDIAGGARYLASASSVGSCTGAARVTCALGTLASGASDVVTLTLAAPAGPATIVSSASAGADQQDPQDSNNASRAETMVLAGHAGAPGVSRPGGAFAPPLLAQTDGPAKVVSTSVALDEGATITVSILDRSGRTVTLLPGSRLDYIPTGRPHTSLTRLIDRARSVPLRLRLKAAPGGRYRIVVNALGPSGQSSSFAVAFGT